MAVLGSNTTIIPTMAIKCPAFTHSGYDAGNEQYYCDYDSWAYGVFAIVGILLIMVPLVSVICCITRYKNRKTHLRRMRSTTSTDTDSYVTIGEQPLIPDQTGHGNAAYGAIENFSPGRSPIFDGMSERQSESHDDISVISSRASLVPNYDQASLDLKNTKAANSTHPTDRPGGLLNPEIAVCSPYASSNVVNSISPKNNPNSPIYVVPEEASPRASYLTTQGPVYSVLENPNESSNTNKPGNSSKEVLNGQLGSSVPGPTNFPKKDNVEEKPEESGSKETGLNLLDADTPNSGKPVYNILEPTKANVPVNNECDEKPSPEKPVYQSLNLSSKETTSGENESNSNERTDDTEEPRYMPLIFPNEKDNTSTSDDNSGGVPLDNAESNPPPKERTKSRADYQELILDAIKSYPVDERNGCFVLHDSISAPGSKALTVYYNNPDTEQEFYNFKVCHDEEGQAYLSKSDKKFSAVDKLLEYLRNNKYMLPCTLRNQIV